MDEARGVWKLTCLICGATPQDFVRQAGENDLITMQRHAAEDHGYMSAEQLRQQTREELGPDHFRWTFPDGMAWLEGKKEDA
jgi:hypothetical protein